MIIRNEKQFENEKTYNIFTCIVNSGYKSECMEIPDYISEEFVVELWNRTMNAEGDRALVLAVPVYDFPKWLEEKRRKDK